MVALQKSEEKFRNISASAQDAILMMDNEGNISFWNEAAEKIFGYTKEEAFGRELHIFLGPKNCHDAYRRGFREFRKTGKGPVIGKSLEMLAIRKDGTEFPVEISVSAIKLKGKWNAIGILRDITERKWVEEKIRAQSKFLQTAIDALTHPFYTINVKDYSISLFNKAAGIHPSEESQGRSSLSHRRDKSNRTSYNG
jgi:PAS domain S-box-containing protein